MLEESENGSLDANSSKIGSGVDFENLNKLTKKMTNATILSQQQHQIQQQLQQQQQPEAACRLKLLRVELLDENLPQGAQLSDLICAINVKEKIEINGKFFLYLILIIF